MAAAGETRLTVNLNHLRVFDPSLTRHLMRRPMAYLHPLMTAVSESARELDPTFAKTHAQTLVQVGFEGSFGSNHVSPRGLLSSLICNLVCVDGIVTKCSVVRPKVMRSVHFCPATKRHLTREYRDDTALNLGLEENGRPMLPTTTMYPTRDPEGNLLETEYGLCEYKDHQVVTIQEMPERAPLGQLPRSVDIYLDHGLVNLVKPGDRVSVSGVFRALGGQNGNQAHGVFRTVIIASNVRLLGKDVLALRMSPEDVRAVRDLPQACAQRGEEVLDVLGRSLSPSIYGHDFIKRALVLQLLGGEEVNLENGTHLRGDVNVMIVGDPSTAKSQLLRSVMKIAPLAVSTTGRGSSGVGLTAAVTSDKDTGERRLEAGAMVLADRGSVCIDEFDKMSEADRVAIHEVMEQQTVTIAKAGIHATLNARCSVTAAANPVYGQYDRSRRPQDNIGLPDSLLSRFDLLFVVLDVLDPENDRFISEHVLRGHCYRRGTDTAPESLVSGPVADELLAEERDDLEGEAKAQVWERSWHSRGDAEAEGGQNLTSLFLRKYIRYAKARVHPELTEAATEGIANAYADLRAKQDLKTLPVTARTLETLIRLSTASAKARLSPLVEEQDVDTCIRLMNFALYHEGADERAPDELERQDGLGADPLDYGAGAPDGEGDGARGRRRSRDDLVGTDSDASSGRGAFDEEEGSSPERSGKRLRRGDASAGHKALLRESIARVVAAMGSESVELTTVLGDVNGDGEVLSREEAEQLLAELESDNLIMYQDGVIYSI